MADENERHLRIDSDDLLAEVDELRAMEREKRQYEISTEPFHEMADAIADKSRHIFEIAADERLTGNRIDGPTNRTTEDVEA